MAKGKSNLNWKQKFLDWKESGKNSHAWSKENNIAYTTLLMLRKKGKTKKREILKNQLIQKAQQYFTNIGSIFEIN